MHGPGRPDAAMAGPAQVGADRAGRGTGNRPLPDVVLMDIEMPGLDGLSAARQIAQDPGTPVIILTAHGHPNLIDQAVQDGVIQYLLKPVTSPSLHAAIQTAVARAREVRSLRDSVNALELT